MVEVKERTEILAAGFGGQGVVRLGQIVGLAAVHQGYRVSMLKSHGTETRGGYVRSQVVLSRDFIDSQVVEDPDYFCAFSAAAYDAYSPLVKQGVILYDPQFVRPSEELGSRHVAVHATEIATRELGSPLYANMVMLGALTAMSSPLFDRGTVLQAMNELLIKYQENNHKAFDLGYSILEVVPLRA